MVVWNASSPVFQESVSPQKEEDPQQPDEAAEACRVSHCGVHVVSSLADEEKKEGAACCAGARKAADKERT